MIARLLTKVNQYFDATVKCVTFGFVVVEIVLFLNLMISFKERISDMFLGGVTLSSALYLISVMISVYTIVERLVQVEAVVDVTSTIKAIPSAFMSAFASVKNKFVYKGESAISNFLFVSILESILPAKMRQLLSRMPFYTKEKILDESSLVETTLAWVLDLPFVIAKLLHAPDSVVRTLQYISTCIPFSRVVLFKRALMDKLDEVRSNKNVVYKPQFQVAFIHIFEQVREWRDALLLEMDRLPHGFKDVYDRAFELYKKILYCKDTARVEPLFCVFYGPPGTGKTTLMLRLIESFKINNSVYSHVSHGADKDFYDQYDGEDILMIDDIGQKGVHQWADMINMVSTAQCTLNCASVENKDLKRFTSRLILATTNNINLRITPVDPISDVEALYRRITLFDFSGVAYSEGVFSGEIVIKRRVLGVNASWREIRRLNARNCEAQLLSYIVDEVKLKKNRFHINDDIVQGVPFIGEHLRCIGFGEFWRHVCNVEFNTSYAGIVVFAIILALFIFVVWSCIHTHAKKHEGIKRPKYYSSLKRDKTLLSEWRGEHISDLFLNVVPHKSNTINSLSRNSVVVQIFCHDAANNPYSTAMFSGRHFTTVRHNFVNLKEPFYVKVFDTDNTLCYDMVKANVVYHSDLDDVVICKLVDTAPVFFRKAPLGWMGKLFATNS